jgi:hypothetical protein
MLVKLYYKYQVMLFNSIQISIISTVFKYNPILIQFYFRLVKKLETISLCFKRLFVNEFYVYYGVEVL